MPKGLYTTFTTLKANNACKERYGYLARKLGGIRNYGEQTHIPLSTILDINGFADTAWALRVVPNTQYEDARRIARLCAADFAERVIEYCGGKDNENIAYILETIRLYAEGRCSFEKVLQAKMIALTADNKTTQATTTYALKAFMSACSKREYDALTETSTYVLWTIEEAYEADLGLMQKMVKKEQEWQIKKFRQYLRQSKSNTKV